MVRSIYGRAKYWGGLVQINNFMGEELLEDVIQTLLQHDDPKVVGTTESFLSGRAAD